VNELFAIDLLTPVILSDDEFLAQAEGRIRGYGKLVVAGIVEIGRELVGVKQRLPRRYEAFVRERLGWSTQHAWNLTNVFEMFQSLNFGDLVGLTIDASSLYLLAAPSTPKEVRDTALKQATTPDGISREQVAKLIEDAKHTAKVEAKAEMDGMLVIPEEELAGQIAEIDDKYKTQIAALEKQRDSARATLKALRKKQKNNPLKMPPAFDSTISFRAMCIEQAMAALREELAITPEQLINIENELAALQGNPGNAMPKIASLVRDARVIADWVRVLLDTTEKAP